MKKLLFSLSALALVATAASAGVIEDRQAAMKERARIVGTLSKVAKGDTAFDAAEVLKQLQALAANAETADHVDVLWPAGSDQGKTESSPKIWEDMAGFKAEADKYKATVDAAVAAAPADAAALQMQIAAVGKECGACHQTYRIKK